MGQRMSVSRRNVVHGMSRTKIYRIWADMIQRCENPNNTNYEYYGARGISVCKQWKDFKKFYEWSAKNGYKKGLSIDRRDPNGNYDPSNCRWVTREIQDNNRRDSVWVEVDGERLTLAQVSRKYNLSYGLLRHRYNVGDRGEKLIDPPKRGVKRNGEKIKPKFKKLNPSTVAEVRWLIHNTDLFQSEIASIYGISQTMVSKIKLGVYHADVKERKPEWR